MYNKSYDVQSFNDDETSSSNSNNANSTTSNEKKKKDKKGTAADRDKDGAIIPELIARIEYDTESDDESDNESDNEEQEEKEDNNQTIKEMLKITPDSYLIKISYSGTIKIMIELRRR